MSHFRFALAQSAFRASGSAETQRLEDWVSGRMMPTLAPLPSTVAVPDELESDALGVLLVLSLLLTLLVMLPTADVAELPGLALFLLEEHALKASEAAAPTTIRPIALLRMGISAFRGM